MGTRIELINNMISVVESQKEIYQSINNSVQANNPIIIVNENYTISRFDEMDMEITEPRIKKTYLNINHIVSF